MNAQRATRDRATSEQPNAAPSVRSSKSYSAAVPASQDQLSLAAIGLESEFTMLVNDEPAKPEKIFGNPRAFIRGPLMHRIGTSYHLPTGGAVYFDTGVIEIATPVIEIARGCAARAGRSLWESVLFLRSELDDWQDRTGNKIRLQGFSSHYNISFDLPAHELSRDRNVKTLAKLLTYILPVPVMILAANKKSTGVGVRPRPGRIEITADFTPEPSLMVAAATFITGVVREVMTWESYDLSMLRKHNIPVVKEFKPIKHTSRKGWLAKDFTFDPKEGKSPFVEDINTFKWKIANGPKEQMTMREIAQYLFATFYRPIARISDPFSFRLIRGVLAGHAPSLLDLPDRPEAYDHVGFLCKWDNLFTERQLERSRYERILMHAIAGDELELNGNHLKPIGMRGWSKIVFKNGSPDKRVVLSIDQLLNHLEDWTHQVRRRAA